MKTSSKTMMKTLVAAGFALAASAAFAFPPGAGPCGGGFGGGPGMARGGGYGPGPMARGYGPGAGFQPGAGPAVNAEARLNFVKNELKITDVQQAAWNAYAEKAKAQAASMWAARSQAASTAQNAPDRVAQRAEFMKQRLAGMEAVSGALKDLYDVLTPEQKATADQLLGGGWRVAQAGRGYGPGYGRGMGGYGPGNGPGMMRGYGPRW